MGDLTTNVAGGKTFRVKLQSVERPTAAGARTVGKLKDFYGDNPGHSSRVCGSACTNMSESVFVQEPIFQHCAELLADDGVMVLRFNQTFSQSLQLQNISRRLHPGPIEVPPSDEKFQAPGC